MKKVWTEGYFPMALGGKVYRPVIMEVEESELGERHDLGKGYFGYVLKHPTKDREYIVETTTGAIIGNSLGEVRKDIEGADIDVMKKQIEAAKQQVKEGTPVGVKDFWGRMR